MAVNLAQFTTYPYNLHRNRRYHSAFVAKITIKQRVNDLSNSINSYLLAGWPQISCISSDKFIIVASTPHFNVIFSRVSTIIRRFFTISLEYVSWSTAEANYSQKRCNLSEKLVKYH